MLAFAYSSLAKSASMMPPELVRGIDELIRTDLQNLRDSYFGWLLLSSGAVAFGVIMEGPEVIHETIGIFRHRSQPEQQHRTAGWITWLALLGWILVALGVAGEGIAEAFVSKTDGMLQTFNEILLIEGQKETGFALERASQNEREAKQLRVDLEKSKANTKAAQARLEREQRKTAEAQAETATAQLSLQKYLDDVAKRQRPRQLDGRKFVKLLEGKPQCRVELLYNPNDSEAWSLATDIYSWLGRPSGTEKGAEWIVFPPKPIPSEAGDRNLFSSNAPPGMRFGGAYTTFGITFRSKETTVPSGVPPPSASACEVTPLSSTCLFFAQEALLGALAKSILPYERGSDWTTDFDNSLPDDLIQLVIGPKPWHDRPDQ